MFWICSKNLIGANEGSMKMKDRKIKVDSLEIIVTGKKEKPYFEIKYRKVGNKNYNTGYSSYDLNNVFDWKNECFEVVKRKKNIFQRLAELF